MAKRKRQIIIRVRQLNAKHWYVSIAELHDAAYAAVSKALPGVTKLRYARRQAEALAAQYRFDRCDVVLDLSAYKHDRHRAEMMERATRG
jgi:hypothetical protein